MAKLLKVKSRDYGEKSYYKYRVNIPAKIIEELGFKEGDDLEIDTNKNGELVLRRKDNGK